MNTSIISIIVNMLRCLYHVYIGHNFCGVTNFVILMVQVELQNGNCMYCRRTEYSSHEIENQF